MDIGGWLRSLGLERYEAAFRENEIDDTVLPSLTARGPEGPWCPVLLDIVGSCSMPSLSWGLTRARKRRQPKLPRHPPERPAQDTAERRQVTVMFSDLVGSTALSVMKRPGGPARGHFGLPEVRCGDRTTLRRVRSEVHGRWHAGVFRLSAGP